jgi:hypothetical protein
MFGIESWPHHQASPIPQSDFNARIAGREWQHSLPACSLALAGRDLHPLDFIKQFHLLHFLDPPPPHFSQRDSLDYSRFC